MHNNAIEGMKILITGGTGSFGHEFTRIVHSQLKPKVIIIYSRDEYKQQEMSRQLNGYTDANIRFIIGDIRDRDALYKAMSDVDVVVHAAALKQVPVTEMNPREAIKTNIMGSENVIDCAIERGVKRVIAISTDKAVNPINLYGATKLCSEVLFLSSNQYPVSHDTRFSIVRYGNVIGSRGSVLPLLIAMRESGSVTVTDERMTRFWISLENAAKFVIDGLMYMQGGEIFVPKLPSMRIVDLVRVIAPECQVELTGIRPGEKLHEVLIAQDDARYTREYNSHYVIRRSFQSHNVQMRTQYGGQPCTESFCYCSDTNTEWLDEMQLRVILHNSGLMSYGGMAIAVDNRG